MGSTFFYIVSQDLSLVLPFSVCSNAGGRNAKGLVFSKGWPP